MTTLMSAHHQWLTRKPDERFVSLDAMYQDALRDHHHSAETVKGVRNFVCEPSPYNNEKDKQGLVVKSRDTGNMFIPSNIAFTQLCRNIDVPPDYMRRLPAEMASDCINLETQVRCEPKDFGVMVRQLPEEPDPTLQCVTGPSYGRVWDDDVIKAAREYFGDGTNGNWTVPGEFNIRSPITKDNTTLYRGDRDMYIFLSDKRRDIEIPNRRNGETGRMQRGIMISQSMAGLMSLSATAFVFDYMCKNHMIHNVKCLENMKIRHSASAPDRWLEQLMPALEEYAASSDSLFKAAIETARNRKLGEKLNQFLENRRYSAGMIARLKETHEKEEQRPIETVWDVVVAGTALAREQSHISERVKMERDFSKLLQYA